MHAPFASSTAEVAETHVSVILFTGDRAYKLKKPVRMDFLDFSTREARERMCHREVELNRRLAPDVYLGVADVLDPSGAPCDHLVVMRRMPPALRLSELVRRGEGESCLRSVARRIASFHAGASRSAEISQAATAAAVRTNWEANLTEMRRFAPAVLDPGELDRIAHLANRYLAGREPLFERRRAEGSIVDGHGDLLADDIFCLPDGPRILDCIEFDDRLRYGDVLADVGFLAMDLERLGAPEAARLFLRSYRDFSGEQHPPSLAHHYIAYRAQVRSKVACLRHDQGEGDAAAEARDLLSICSRHLQTAPVRLVLVGGLPGTGKTTLARGLAEVLGWPLIRSDEVRKELCGLAPEATLEASYREGIYSPEMTARTYRSLLDRARVLLQLGYPVLLDASWIRAGHRSEAETLAAGTHSDLVQLRCEVSEEVAAQRLLARAGTDASDATPETSERMRAEMDRWPAATPIDTSQSTEASLDAGLRVAADLT